MEPRNVQTARKAWQALFKGVRAVNLYTPGHTEVSRHVQNVVNRLREAHAVMHPVLFEFGPDWVASQGVVIHEAVEDRETLIERLYADGVRQFLFHGPLDADAAERLLSLLAPYAHAERAPMQGAAQALRWEPFQGLSFLIHGQEDDPGGLEADAVTAAERRWFQLLTAPDPELAQPLPVAALRPAWDGKGGRVPWPSPIRRTTAEALDEEVARANAEGVPLDRVGELLLASILAWRRDPRLESLVAPLPGLVRDLLQRGRPADVARLLGPALRWAEQNNHEPAAEQLDGLVPLLLADESLGALISAVRTGEVEPAELTAFFEALPADSLPDVVEFGAALPEGPFRSATITAAVRMAALEGGLLYTTITTGAPGPALVALDVLEMRGATRDSLQVTLDALARPEAALRSRALSILQPHPSRTVAEAVLPLVHDGNREVRNLALAWVGRYEYGPAFEELVDLTRAAHFTQLPMQDRLDVCRTIGVVGGSRALPLVRDSLGDRWERADANRSAPWLACLAATGTAEAGDFLASLQRTAPEHLRDLSRRAWAVWERRHAVLARSGRPGPVQTAPGSPVPTRHGDPVSLPGRARPRSRPAWSSPEPDISQALPPTSGDLPPWNEEDR